MISNAVMVKRIPVLDDKSRTSDSSWNEELRGESSD